MIKITCRVCLQEKDSDNFYKKGGKSKLGYERECKPCCKLRQRMDYRSGTEVAERQKANKRKKYKQSEEYKKYQLQRHKKYREENKEKELLRCQKYRENHRDQAKDYYRVNNIHLLEQKRLYRKNNKDKVRASHKKWCKNNKSKLLAYYYRRQKNTKIATPSWANHKAIEAIYIESELISTTTGILHHVDHIVPLQGKNVCGLHVENNLQIIPATENLSKSNKFIDK